MSLVLNVEILGEFKKLTEATKGSQKSLGNLEDSAKKISSGINKTLGLIGVGFSLNFLVDQFKESTKAAIEDQKSKVLLTQALENNLKVSKQQNDEIERFITKTQLATSVTDDKLRPAFAKLAIATKDTDQAMKLMTVALDAAAGTGKGLDTVVQAMSRALAGNETALFRLVPSIRGADDPMKALAETFKGAAEAAANTDPYAKMQVIFGEMQEQIGEALLPVLTDFSTWLTTPEGQEKLQAIVDGIVEVVEWFGKLGEFIDNEVMPMLEALTGEKGFGAVLTAVTNLAIFLGTLKIALLFYQAGPLAPVLAGLALLAGAMWTVYQNTKKASDATVEFQRLQGLKPVLTTPMTPEQVAGRTYRGLIGEVPTTPNLTQRLAPVQVPLGNTSIIINNNRAQVDGGLMVDQINKALKDRGLSAKALK
jgi:hypothetical protein